MRAASETSGNIKCNNIKSEGSKKKNIWENIRDYRKVMEDGYN